MSHRLGLAQPFQVPGPRLPRLEGHLNEGEMALLIVLLLEQKRRILLGRVAKPGPPTKRSPILLRP